MATKVANHRQATHYAEVVVILPLTEDGRDSEMGFHWDYFDGEPTAQDVASLIPEGWAELERRIKIVSEDFDDDDADYPRDGYQQEAAAYAYEADSYPEEWYDPDGAPGGYDYDYCD